MTYNKEIYKEPFWAENSGFMTGRDPLGIQNSSVAIYSRLLPGMTNLTQRLRYYGFYMWVLYEYDQKFGINNSLEATLNQHYNFIRRSELIIAYLMINAFPDQQHIVGSDFANKYKSSVNATGYYKIHVGADKSKDTVKGSVYWDYKSGAFGQYYAPSLINLNLITTEYKYFRIQDLGKELALAFKENIGDKLSGLFLSIIESGELTIANIEELQNFSISNIPLYSREWHFYNRLLSSDDGDSFKKMDGSIPSHRLETIRYYLSYIGKPEIKNEFSSFKEDQYQLNINKVQVDASFGWYYYYIIEALHYSIESIFWGFLVELDGRVVLINDFIKTLCESIVKESLSRLILNESQTVNEILNRLPVGSFFLNKDIERLTKEVKSPINSIFTISLAFEIIFKIYIENKPNIPEIKSFEKNNMLNSRNGSVIDIFNGFIENHLATSYMAYTESIIKSLMSKHIYNAYRKMGDGESNLLKFVIEENNITLVQKMDPKFTSPRIQSMHNYLNDLSYIDKDGKINKVVNGILQNKFQIQ